jgi:16S rRNA processing protein RimM
VSITPHDGEYPSGAPVLRTGQHESSSAGTPAREPTVEVLVGVVGRPHGVRGEVAIELRTDEPERRFAVGARLRIEDGDAVVVVTGRRLHGDRLLVRFGGLADRTAVEALRGVRLVADVPVDERPDDAEEFYDRQLIGLRVLDHAGIEVGTVAAVLHRPAQDLLEIDTDDGARLVPFVSALVPTVDPAAGLLRLADVPGLLTDEAG